MRKMCFFLLLIFLSFTHLHATTIKFEHTGTGKTQNKIADAARAYLGTPYVSGGTGKSGVDCSGLVFRVYLDAARLSLPRQVVALAAKGARVKGKRFIADLVFFDTEGKGQATHVGIYIGDNKIIHAASAGKKQGVIASSLDDAYYKKRLLFTRRILSPGYPLVRVEIDDLPVTQSGAPVKFTPGIPLYFSITHKEKRECFVEFIAYKNSEAVIVKRFRLSGNGKPSLVWFIPDKGTWQVKVKAKSDFGSALIGIN